MEKGIEGKVENIQPGVDFVELFSHEEYRGKFVAIQYNTTSKKYDVVACGKDSLKTLEEAENKGYLNTVLTRVPKNPSSYLVL